MRWTRRRLIIGLALNWILTRAIPSRAESSRPPGEAEATLRAYVDVLIPADETPSASALGVDRQLLVVAKGQPDYLRLLELGLNWLNLRARTQYGRSFSDLDDASREAIVGEAAGARHSTLQRLFFERTRADSFFHYYGRPESWRGIVGYRGPPQPLGFSDFAEPPRAAR